jgi:hypothetical protein
MKWTNRPAWIVNFLSKKVSDEHSDHENIAIDDPCVVDDSECGKADEAPHLFFIWKALDPSVSRSEGGGEQERRRGGAE